MGQSLSAGAARQEAEEGGGGVSGSDRSFEVVNVAGALASAKSLPTQVQLALSASNLPGRDEFRSGDPILVGYVKHEDESCTEFGRTEVVEHTWNPKWNSQLSILYCSEEVQTLRFVIYDMDPKKLSQRLNESQELDFERERSLAQMDILVTEIIQAPEQCVTRCLQEHAIGKRYGIAELTVRVEEPQKSKGAERVMEIDELELLVHDQRVQTETFNVDLEIENVLLEVGKLMRNSTMDAHGAVVLTQEEHEGNRQNLDISSQMDTSDPTSRQAQSELQQDHIRCPAYCWPLWMWPL